MDYRTVEKAIIRLQQTYIESSKAAEQVGQESTIRIRELNAAVTALGELWKVLSATERHPKEIDDRAEADEEVAND
jgi:hypothetical protein